MTKECKNCGKEIDIEKFKEHTASCKDYEEALKNRFTKIVNEPSKKR